MASALGVVAMMGSRGRKTLMRRAERPECVGQMMAEAPTRRAVSTAANPMAPFTFFTPPRSW